jgi:Secretion system C-terminal sorting domain
MINTDKIKMKKLIFIFILLAAKQTDGQALYTVSQWESLFQNSWAYEYSVANPQSLSNDSWQYYNLAYSIDANTTIFQATGDTIYLNRALHYINNMISSAVPSYLIPTSQFQDSYLSWANHSHPTLGNDGMEYPLFESFCWRYVSTLLRIIKNSPSLLSNPNYYNQYNTILSFTETNIFEKWNSRGANSYIYRENTHMASHWARICMDLFCITNDSTYWTVFDNFNNHMPNYASSMRGQIRPHPLDSLAYWWDDDWTNFDLPGQDVSHGNAVVAAIIESYDMCLEYNIGDINALIKTFNLIWIDSVSYAEYIDGTGLGNGWFNDGFIKLGRYDTLLQKRIQNHTVGPGTQLYGNGALNACILANGVPLFPENTCTPLSLIQPSINKFKILLYPNPASDIVTLNLNNGLNADLTLNFYNVIGVFVKNEILKQNKRQINIGDLSNGVYIVSIKSKGLTENQKLIIQR